MICFRDMTFCSADCANVGCRRNFTDKQRQDAREWWNHDPDNAPVAFADFAGAGCSEYKPATSSYGKGDYTKE